MFGIVYVSDKFWILSTGLRCCQHHVDDLFLTSPPIIFQKKSPIEHRWQNLSKISWSSAVEFFIPRYLRKRIKAMQIEMQNGKETTRWTQGLLQIWSRMGSQKGRKKSHPRNLCPISSFHLPVTLAFVEVFEPLWLLCQSLYFCFMTWLHVLSVFYWKQSLWRLHPRYSNKLWLRLNFIRWKNKNFRFRIKDFYKSVRSLYCIESN